MSIIPNLDEIDERYFVRGRMEIQGLLMDLVYRAEVLEAGAEGRQAMTQCRLLDASRDGIVFDFIADAAIPDISTFPSLSFIGHPDGIRIQFRCGSPEKVNWDGRDALRVPLPECVARVQRHESLRTWVAGGASMPVSLFAADDGLLGEHMLRDLSAGGLGISANAAWSGVSAQKIARARFRIGSHGDIDCGVSLRHCTEEENGTVRIGLSFVDLGSEARGRIQRFVIENEHQRQDADLQGREGE